MRSSTTLRKLIIQLLIAGSIFVAAGAHAQEIAQDKETVVKATVLEVMHEERRTIPGTDTPANYQTIRVRILEGEEQGKEVTVENDYLNLKKGEVFYLLHSVGAYDGKDAYSVFDAYRLPALVFFVGLFVVCVVIFGGIQGVRGLVSLAGGFLLIIYVLLPGILHGWPPVVVSIGVASLVIILGSYVTHGFNRTTTAAVLGMLATILITGILAWAGVHFARLGGYASEETTYLNFNTRGAIDFAGLLLGGIIIGLLGILYDAAISQAIAVEELVRAGPHLHARVIYRRALRIGREHIGALVNTLAIAYTGAALPLILLFYNYHAGFASTINREIFATEIIRIIVGSIGLVLAVPITTLIAGVFLCGRGSRQKR